MTDRQKEAVLLLSKIKATPDISGEAVMTDDQYLMLLEFVVGQPSPAVIQPANPWPLTPIYGETSKVFEPPYRVTCEFTKD